jgi:hypothetical protein
MCGFLDFAASLYMSEIRDITRLMARPMKVPLARLVFLHREIGSHRDRRWGLREVFGFPTLQNLPFMHLAARFRRAYEGKDTPRHEGWPAQRDAIQWLVDRGRDGIYALDEAGIKIKATPFRSYAITDGNHRALALYVLGESEVRALLQP